MADTLKRILCVDDDNDILEVARMCLEAVGGFEVIICSIGAEAPQIAHEVKPDLIMLDVMMPGTDGPTVFKHLREDPALQNTPVVFMTARVQPREVNDYLSLGGAAVIAKPFDPMQLSQQITDIWQKTRR